MWASLLMTIAEQNIYYAYRNRNGQQLQFPAVAITASAATGTCLINERA